jgi:uncharacterized protein YdaU (DUF1376 family)
MASLQKPEWFKFDAAKFLSDAVVDALTTLELGCCIRLLCRQWIDGYILDDPHLLARLCRLDDAAMAEAWVTLANFFPEIEPGKRANRYMWIERERVIADLEHRSDEGTRAARKRWDAVMKKRDAEPNGSPMPGPMQDQIRAEQIRTNTSKSENGFDQSVGLVWDHYISVTGRNPKLYTFTPTRKRMGVARLRDLLPRVKEPKTESAVELMKMCVDRLSKSPFHNGQNEPGKKYLDWEVLFRSIDKMEKWLAQDDDRSANKAAQ